MRRWVLSILFSFVFASILSFSVSAQVCGSNGVNDLIMRISASTNAQGEVWNGGSYPTDICFSTIFGSPYTGVNSGGPAVHNCIGNVNDVLRLNAPTNAHAEVLEGPVNYGTTVCYGDLVCRSTTGSCNLAGEREVVSLFASTNAHLEVATGTAYTTKICCSTTPPQITKPIWKYYDGTQIPENAGSPTLICPNSYVTMSINTTGLSEGAPINFQVIDDDGLIGDDNIGPVLTVPVVNNQANITLNLTNPVILGFLNPELNEAFEGNELELFFTATNTIYSNSSYIIRYSNNASLCNYPDPISFVIAPVHQGIYFTNTNITFASGCNSQVGPVQNEWTITQNDAVLFTNTSSRFNFTFTNPGHTNVKLKCTDLSGSYDVNESQILVVASPYTLAYINKPRFDSFVYENPVTGQPYFPQTVRFSAADSFVVDTTPGTTCPTVQCLGGDCPALTENSPNSCGGVPIPVTGAPPVGTTPNYADLIFDWRFWDSNWNEPWTLYEGSNKSQGVVLYDDVSTNINDKHMSVSVTHTTSSSVVTTASFQRDFTLGLCLNGGNTLYSSGTPLSTSVSGNACKGGDGAAQTADDCCPTGQQCLPSSGSSTNYHCQFPNGGSVVTRCEEFTGPTECNGNTNPLIPLASYGPAPICTYLQCYWITSGASINTCGVRATQYQYTPQNGCGVLTNGCPESDCAWSTTQTECLNGRKTISYTGSVISIATCAVVTWTCDKSPVTVPCGSLNFELSFFGKIQFMIAIISIAALYFAFGFCRRKKHDKKNYS